MRKGILLFVAMMLGLGLVIFSMTQQTNHINSLKQNQANMTLRARQYQDELLMVHQSLNDVIAKLNGAQIVVQPTPIIEPSKTIAPSLNTKTTSGAKTTSPAKATTSTAKPATQEAPTTTQKPPPQAQSTTTTTIPNKPCITILPNKCLLKP